MSYWGCPDENAGPKMRRLTLALALLMATPAAHAADPCGLPADYDTLKVLMVGLQPLVDIRMDDVVATMVLDTGASETVITENFAARVNSSASQPLRPRSSSGIGGTVTVRRGFIETMRIGSAIVRSVNLTVSPVAFGGQGQTRDGLFGLDLLALFDVDIDLEHGRVKLFRGHLCPDATSPWPVDATEIKARRAAQESTITGTPLSANRTDQRPARLEVPLVLNGKIIWALIDTGATNSIVTQAAAARMGVLESALATDPVGNTRGATGRVVQIRVHRFDSLRVAGETLNNPQLLVGPLPGGTDMLLGMDYLRNHRVWLSYATARVFVAKGKPAD